MCGSFRHFRYREQFRQRDDSVKHSRRNSSSSVLLEVGCKHGEVRLEREMWDTPVCCIRTSDCTLSRDKHSHDTHLTNTPHTTATLILCKRN